MWQVCTTIAATGILWTCLSRTSLRGSGVVPLSNQPGRMVMCWLGCCHTLLGNTLLMLPSPLGSVSHVTQ